MGLPNLSASTLAAGAAFALGNPACVQRAFAHTPGLPLGGAVAARLFGKRIVLITGKGGVGRTSIAAALALAASRQGKRTLLLEIGDPEGGSSPLARHFGRERFTAEPAELAVRLSGLHLWAPHGQELFLRHHLPAGALVGAAMRSRALQAFLSAAPSFLEMGWFYHLLTLIRARRPDGEPLYELIALDMPATGHALALAGLPEILKRLLRRGPIVEGLEEGERYLHDPAMTSAWVVTLPEPLPVTEALELVQGLRTNRVGVGGVLLNRCPQNPFTEAERAALAPRLPDDVLGALAFRRIERHLDARARLNAERDLPVVEVPELPLEGTALLSGLATEFQLAIGGSTELARGAAS
jgi:arsenite/tail-anchored protein-transporting ATPase